MERITLDLTDENIITLFFDINSLIVINYSKIFFDFWILLPKVNYNASNKTRMDEKNDYNTRP